MSALLPGWRSLNAVAHIVSLKDLHSRVDQLARKRIFAVLPGCHARGYCLLATPAIFNSDQGSQVRCGLFNRSRSSDTSSAFNAPGNYASLQRSPTNKNALQIIAGRFKFGVADGARTHDNRNHNPGLYQLSYSHRRSSYSTSGLVLLNQI